MKSHKTIAAVAVLMLIQLKGFCNDPVKIILSGNLNIEYSKGESTDSEELGMGIMPQFGIMLYDRLEMGIGGGYSFKDYSAYGFYNNGFYQYSDSKEKNRSFNVYVRDNIFRKDRLSIFYGLYYNHGKGEIKTENPLSQTNTIETKNFGIGINTGLNFALSDKIELTTSFGVLNYTKHTYKPENAKTRAQNNISFLIDFSSIYFGLRFVL